MDSVDAQEAGPAVRLRRAALAHCHRRCLRPLDHRALRPIGPRTPQVVDVARGDPGEALEARVAEDMVLAVQHHPRREPGHLAQVRVHPGQQPDVGRRVHAREGPPLVAVPAVDHLRRLVVLADEPRQLGARVAGGLRQATLHQRLRRLVQHPVAELRQRPRREGVGTVPVQRLELHRRVRLDERRQPARWFESVRSVVSRSSPAFRLMPRWTRPLLVQREPLVLTSGSFWVRRRRYQMEGRREVAACELVDTLACGLFLVPTRLQWLR